MKIGVDIRCLMDAYYSGVPEYTLNLLRALLRIDHENEYHLFYNSWQDMSERIPDFSGANVKIVKTAYPNKIFNYFLQKGLAYPRLDTLLGVDVFFAPHLNFFALSAGVRKVITVHDLSFLRYPDFFSARKNFWHRMIDAPRTLRGFDRIVAVSENTKRDIVDLCGIPGERVEVIYSAIDSAFRKMDVSNPDDKREMERVREKYELGRKIILYLGTIEPRKNIDGIIRAFDLFLADNPEFGDYELVLAGGNGWKTENIYQVWENSPNKGRIRFLGYVDREDKPALYNCASLFFYPSFYEGFGLPPLEAVCSGVPTITSSSSSVPEIVGSAAFLVDPYNISEMSKALAWVISKIEKENYQSSPADLLNSSWDEVAAKYLDIFLSGTF